MNRGESASILVAFKLPQGDLVSFCVTSGMMWHVKVTALGSSVGAGKSKAVCCCELSTAS